MFKQAKRRLCTRIHGQPTDDDPSATSEPPSRTNPSPGNPDVRVPKRRRKPERAATSANYPGLMRTYANREPIRTAVAALAIAISFVEMLQAIDLLTDVQGHAITGFIAATATTLGSTLLRNRVAPVTTPDAA